MQDWNARELPRLVIKIWRQLGLGVTELLEINRAGVHRHRRELGQELSSGTC